MRQLGGFREIAGEYDGFVLDLWGVVHDGVRPYPDAPACLAALAAAGKRCVMLTNAPRGVGGAGGRARAGPTPPAPRPVGARSRPGTGRPG